MLLGVLGTNEIIILLVLVIVVGFLISKFGKTMKKFFGVLFLIIGLVLVGLGIGLLVELSSRNDSFEGRVRDRFNEHYRSDNDDQQTGGITLIAGGALFFIIGIIMVASKSNSQRKKDAELEVLRSMQSYPAQTEQKTEARSIKNSGQSINDVYIQLEKLGKLKEQGILNEEEFQQQKKKILG